MSQRFRSFTARLLPASSAAAKGIRPHVASLVTSDVFWLACIGLLTLVVYGPILNDWFTKDDFFFLRAARFASPPEYVKESFDFTGYDRHERLIDFIRDQDIALPFLAYRPLYFLSLEGMYLVFGKHAEGYHAVSLLVHLTNVLLVWRIATRLLGGKLAPRMAALIFAVHPTYVAAVAWISDIATPLATFAALLSLLFLMKSMDSARLHLGWYTGSLVSYAASMFFHTETLSWVAVFVAFFLVAPAFRNSRLQANRWLFLLPFIAIALGSYRLHSWILAHTPANEQVYHIGPHMFTNFKNLASLALFPVDDGETTAHFIAFVVLLLMMACLPLLAVLDKKRTAVPRTELFVLVWFLASLAPLLTPDGNIWFSNHAIARKLYVAGPALSIFLALFGASLLRLSPMRLKRHVQLLATVLLLAALAASLVQAGDHREQVSTRASEWERFVQALQQTYPSLPKGSTLYIVGAPLQLSFGEFHLVSAVQAFYGKVDVYAITEERALELERSLDDGDHIYRY